MKNPEVAEAFEALEEGMRSKEGVKRSGLNWLDTIRDYVIDCERTKGYRPITQPAYTPFVKGCQEHGIGRTTAYSLLNEGLLDTFLIGTSRYVMVESLRTLPERLKGAKR